MRVEAIHIGRPKVVVDAARIKALHTQGAF